jgi:glycerophosphoryl diester phosphodiesterase
MKKWLIAHRGAQCDGRENTKAAFVGTNKYPLGGVELDVHTTKDGAVICHHNFDINGEKIADSTFSKLKKLDPELITLDEAILIIGKELPIIIEIKPKGTAKNIIKYLNDNSNCLAVSFKTSEIKYLVDAGIDKRRLCLSQRGEPLDHIKNATDIGCGGLVLNHAYVNPIWYYRAKKAGFKMYTYTVNSLIEASLMRLFYPKLLICTNRPDKLQKLR